MPWLASRMILYHLSEDHHQCRKTRRRWRSWWFFSYAETEIPADPGTTTNFGDIAVVPDAPLSSLSSPTEPPVSDFGGFVGTDGTFDDNFGQFVSMALSDLATPNAVAPEGPGATDNVWSAFDTLASVQDAPISLLSGESNVRWRTTTTMTILGALLVSATSDQTTATENEQSLIGDRGDVVALTGAGLTSAQMHTAGDSESEGVAVSRAAAGDSECNSLGNLAD